MEQTHEISIEITQQEMARIKQFAESQNKTVGEVLSDAVESAVAALAPIN